ncbi:MAG: hypothetical protein Q9191_005514 [Dirinaria sp. TL-2023a]
MATSTPQRRSLARPSLGHSAVNTASSSSFGSSTRKSSLARVPTTISSTINDNSERYGSTGAEEGGSAPMTMQRAAPSGARTISGDAVGNKDLEIGDAVDVPGGMHGIVKFIGEVNGKKGVFAGVELNKEWAARGKNNGDVEGIRYFTTSIPGAGIFLPSSKAFKRLSRSFSSDSFPPTPTTPSLAALSLGGKGQNNAVTPPTPSASKFSQSVGPGRVASPALKPRSRPSLPRPESPLRKAQNANAATPSGRPSLGASKFSKGGVGTPRYAPSPTPGKFGSSVGPVRGAGGGDPAKKAAKAPAPASKTPGNARPASRNLSRPDSRFDNDLDNTPTGFLKGTRSRQSSLNDEIQDLRAQLAERDNQLKEQASSLLEMESSITELHSLIPPPSPQRRPRISRHSSINDEADAAQLRALLREKNEKIAALTADFDAHRADFRSTIDTLELASTETERVYEKKVEDLTQELRDLQDRGDDVDTVAAQLKQLEELVQELEEGLEDARRGEAEARGEVEFLRGEVERGRSELKRERENAAKFQDSGFASQRSSREVEQRDDEIRGLKAIIHSLSRDAPDVVSPKGGSRRVSRQRHSGHAQANGTNDDALAEERKAREKLEREIKDLENLVDAKTYREEELENELKRLRQAQKQPNLISQQKMSPVRSRNSDRSRESCGDQNQASPGSAPRRVALGNTSEPEDSHSEITDGSNQWCEICEAPGHDILTCTNMFGSNPSKGSQQQQQKTTPNGHQRTGRDAVVEGLKGISSSPQQPNGIGNNGQTTTAPAASPQTSRPQPAATEAPKAPMPNPMDTGMVAGKSSRVVDEGKWCALCERDGHESVDCPFDEEIY